MRRGPEELWLLISGSLILPQGEEGAGLVSSTPIPSSVVTLAKQNLAKLGVVVIYVYLPLSGEFLEDRGHV